MSIFNTLILSILGIVLASSIGLPLPFLLGPLIFLTFSSMLRIQLNSFAHLHKPVFFILGVYLGATLLTNMQYIDITFLGSLAYMLVFNGIAIVIIAWYFVKFAKYSKAEALFTALPGLLAYIATYCNAYNISFEKVVIPHTIRVIIIVLCMPFLYHNLAGTAEYHLDVHTLNISTLQVDIHYAVSVAFTIAIISICALPFLWVFKNLHVANFYFLAGMIASILAYQLPGIDTTLPSVGLQLILMFIGIMIGTRLSVVKHKDLLNYSVIGIISTVLLVVLTLIFSYGGSFLFGKNFATIFLAYAPGGVHEMVSLALIYGIEPLFVTIHHIVRIMVLSFFLPIIGKATIDNKTS